MSKARSGHGEQVRVSGARASEAGPAASGSAAFRNHPPCPEMSPCQPPPGVTATASRGGPARPCRKLRGDVSVQPGRGTPALPRVPSSSGAPGPLPSAGADPVSPGCQGVAACRWPSGLWHLSPCPLPDSRPRPRWPRIALPGGQRGRAVNPTRESQLLSRFLHPRRRVIIKFPACVILRTALKPIM